MSSDVVLNAQLPAKSGRIPAEDLPAIAERYRGGESLTSIAATYGVGQDPVWGR